MNCLWNESISCPLEDVVGACFFCEKIDEDVKDAVSTLPVLEADVVHFMEED